MIDYLGWAATAVFVTSYFCSNPATLKRVQMAGALMWIGYGIVLGASPVVVANALVFGAAAWTMGSGLPGGERHRGSKRSARRFAASGSLSDPVMARSHDP